MKLKRTLWVALGAVVLAAVAGIGICFAYFLTPTEYCLLLFGPDGETRVWVEVRGQTIFLHRDSLKSPAERVRQVNEEDGDIHGIEILNHDGRTRYVLTSISAMPIGETANRHVMACVDVKGLLDYKQYCDVELRSNPNDVAVAHFAGPLTAGPRTINWKLPEGLKLVTGDKPTDLFVNIGTMDSERGCWVVVRTHEGEKSAFAEGVFPMIEVVFPPKSPGGQPVVRQYPIDKFC